VPLIDPALWSKSRAGARAGRGFRYQDIATALLAVQSWAGASWQVVIPEGLDDATLHGPMGETRVQMKSRHDPRGLFTPGEVADYIEQSAKTLSADDLRRGTARIVTMLERPMATIAETGLNRSLADDDDAADIFANLLTGLANDKELEVSELLAAIHIVVVPDPANLIVAEIVKRADCIDAAGRLVADRLRRLVGALADANFVAPAGAPASLDASDVQALVDDVLKLVDHDAALAAVRAGICEPVLFTPIVAPDFYEGVDVLPGHVGAGLVFDRSDLTDEISSGLQRRGAALVAGPSGSGKSACAWLSAHASRHAVRWYRVRRVSLEQVQLLADLAQAIEASPERPVGFVFDDLGRNLGGAWNALRELVDSAPGLLMLGTVREEDLYLVGDLSGTALVRPALDEDLAMRVCLALRAERELSFVNWREPFERSQGLMLEYVHLLTSGQHLQDTLDQQVRQRLSEQRDDELRVLRAVASVARFGGSVNAARLRARLELTEGAFSRALVRLVDEHAVRISSDGTLTGLHEIRSTGLHFAISKSMPYEPSAMLAELADVAEPHCFAILLPRLLANQETDDEGLLDALALRAAALSADELAILFYGLGLVMCDRLATQWLAIAEEEGLEARIAATPMILAMAGTTIDGVIFERANAVVERRSELDQPDLRTGLLQRLDAYRELKPSFTEYHELAASLVPLPFLTESPDFDLLPEEGIDAASFEEILDLLGTTRWFKPVQAQRVVNCFGGTDLLLARVHLETAWSKRPELIEESDGLVVSSNLRLVDPIAQADPNELIVAHCARLIAAAPTADFAKSTIIGWDGRRAGITAIQVEEKRLAREQIPSPASIAWRRAILRAVQRHHASPTESGRANSLSNAINDLAGILETAAESFCRGKAADPMATLAVSIRTILNSMIEAPSVDLHMRSAREPGLGDINDDLHSFVTSVTNLASGLGDNSIDRPLIKASESADLCVKAGDLIAAPEWRWLDSAPREALDRIARTLDDVDSVLGLVHGNPAAWRSAQRRAEKSSQHNRTLPRAAGEARQQAREAAETRAHRIEQAFAGGGMEVEVITRPCRDNAFAWPRVDYLALVKIGELSEFIGLSEAILSIGREAAGDDKLFVVPVIRHQAIGMLAVTIGSILFPDSAFATDWGPLLPYPVLKERSAAIFQDIMSAAAQLSSILANADRPANTIEEAFGQDLVDKIRAGVKDLEQLRNAEPDADLIYISAFVIEVFNRLSAELNGEATGETIASEMARLGFGEVTELNAQITLIKLGLTQRDVLAAAEMEDKSAFPPSDP
jgi:hypothetical protein